MKLGIVGKGGTGKTTLAALMARTWVQRGRRVLAVDTDSNPNLALNLGLDAVTAEALPVLPRSVTVGAGGADASPRQLMVEYGRSTPVDVTLMHAMRVTEAGAGCTCGSHASVRSLLGATLDEEADVTIVDMEAGLEHLSRSGGTLAHADVLLVVMDPSRKAVLTASRTRALAAELGIDHCYGVGNKAHLPDDAEFFEAVAAEHDVELAGIVPHAPQLAKADRDGELVDPRALPAVAEALTELVEFVERVHKTPAPVAE